MSAAAELQVPAAVIGRIIRKGRINGYVPITDETILLVAREGLADVLVNSLSTSYVAMCRFVDRELRREGILTDAAADAADAPAARRRRAPAKTPAASAETAEQKGRRQLQELYLLDNVNGDRHLAYYGQCRAREKSHLEAMLATVEYFSSLWQVKNPALAAWLEANR